MTRAFRAGDTVEDHCRACKTDRLHTVIVADSAGRPIRVSCDYCESQHNYRGGPRIDGSPSSASAPSSTRVQAAAEPLPLVSDRERTSAHVPASDLPNQDLELLLRRIIPTGFCMT